MNSKEKTKRFFVIIVFLVVLGLLFRFGMRPFLQNWGASSQITEMTLPGDTIVQSPSYTSTHAITVHAKSREIYPWLVQMGKGKAGFYGLDWFRNGFKKSAEEIIPVFQNLKVGDTIKYRLGLEMAVEDYKKDTFIVWKNINNNANASLTWYLIPDGKRETKLIARYKIDYDYTKPATIIFLLRQVIDMPMSRQTLRGIMNRSEGLGYAAYSNEIARAVLTAVPFIALLIFLFRMFKKENYMEPFYMVIFMLVIFTLQLYIIMPLWILVIVTFIVLLTLIGTAAETAALKQEQQTKEA